ncbi:hypothetical protein Q2T83_17955 [Fervidibacter sacchari]|uniref:ABC transporter permease n=1 Tax=Candidatus Fervidibacter sacchari TaxID=1448929 RepID=A0ABT2EKJ2_9BACT|nr:hypothetical protein [Candidatus Fervidibacter sacchari]MCS3918411.1 hypothetical protein [Candidatus Fervidibacter sacchari]WKU16195.1 hypothetical protein Q2T83_17955 [Candidatus Fervidibacter sacchari]
MGNYWRFESNPFWHHEWKDFDAEVFIRDIRGLIAGAIAVQIGLASFFLIDQASPFWAGTNLFLVAMISHFIALNYIDRRIPRRSFVDDAQRGSLDFLRLLPVSSYELVIARKLPFWFLRLFVAGLWSPLYAAAFALLGLPIATAIPFSLLLGTSGWMEIFGLILLFFLPVPASVSLPLLFLLATLWSSEGIQRLGSAPPERRVFFAAAWTVLLTLGIIAMQFQGVEKGSGGFHFFAPQPFYGTALTPIWATFWLMAAVGWARVDRLARWLETPKGLRRFYFAPSLFAFLFLSQGYLWGWLKQVRHWQPADCFAASASFTFAFAGVLHWLWFNWAWAEKTPPEKPPMAWLAETFAWRLVSVFVPLLGCWLTSLPISKLDITFLHVWLFVSVADAFSLALTRSLVLRGMVQWRIKGLELLSSFAIVPLIGFVLKLPLFVAFSPSLALLVLGWQLALSPINPLRVGWLLFSITLPNIPLWMAAAMPPARLILLWLVWQLVNAPVALVQQNFGVAKIAHLFAFVTRFGEFAFVLPAIERLLLTRSQNPVFRHMVAATRWRYGWLPYLAAFAFGLFVPSLTAVVFFAFLLIFVPTFWFATYLTVHSYLRKLHQTGELWQWLITPLPSATIVNGWRYGGWWWQFRWLALFLWLFIGGCLGGGFSRLPQVWLWLISTPLLVLATVIAALIFASMVMGAVPIAIVDAFREPRRAFSTQGQKWSKGKALRLAGLMSILVGISVGTCGFLWFIAPFVGLAMTSTSIDPAVRSLEHIRKAPMDKLP